VVACVCNNICLFVTLVVSDHARWLAVLSANCYSRRHEIFGIAWQWLWDHAVECAEWQHHAIGVR